MDFLCLRYILGKPQLVDGLICPTPIRLASPDADVTMSRGGDYRDRIENAEEMGTWLDKSQSV